MKLLNVKDKAASIKKKKYLDNNKKAIGQGWGEYG